ncbi:intradiol ring-cleavage dioxygenase [Paraburkholderia haematera]|uniref:Hydroxyquinol 1,2-dioxygenase n=1 Tax=Paraburkholderia haematera TaxID=2793077 RepID=A0ABM8RJ30_9BURK|nr:intradiol ring-cleavage dioxygenase [Paraburkholderia haematera]CAE6755845.1 Hydroxyquinol 1,2-dioxygenase [Paraburkholderia haematera]
MRNFDENNITTAVIDRLAECTSPRARQISESLVRHLHDFVRDVEPTQEEWGEAIGFLTGVGKMCSDTRQEFILLSDALGVSMLVDAINHRLAKHATETTVLGPFYVENPPEYALGDLIDTRPGPALFCEGKVTDVDGKPLAGAIVDTWHSDAEGFYDVQAEAGLKSLTGRARLRTDAEGRFWFRSIVPKFYPIPHDGPVGKMLEAQGRHPYRPAHVHFMISAPGYEKLITHVFLDGDPYLDSDVVFGVKDSLVKPLVAQQPGTTPAGHAVDAGTSLLHYDFALAREAISS